MGKKKKAKQVARAEKILEAIRWRREVRLAYEEAVMDLGLACRVPPPRQETDFWSFVEWDRAIDAMLYRTEDGTKTDTSE